MSQANNRCRKPRLLVGAGACLLALLLLLAAGLRLRCGWQRGQPEVRRPEEAGEPEAPARWLLLARLDEGDAGANATAERSAAQQASPGSSDGEAPRGRARTRSDRGRRSGAGAGKGRSVAKRESRQEEQPWPASLSAAAAPNGHIVSKRSRTERKPILNEFSFPPNLVQGMRFVLVCQVLEGQAPVQIRWLKDGRELLEQPAESSAEQVELVAGEELGSSLLFRRVQAQHSGNYTCLAGNQFGQAAYSSYMSVKVPPSWKVEPEDQHSIQGQQISIDCQAFGNPNPFIRWKFQHQVPASSTELASAARQQPAAGFKLIKSNHHMQTLENGSLSIRQLSQADHEGLYLCEAENGLEPSLSKLVRLAVHQPAQLLEELQALGASAEPLLQAPGTGSHSGAPLWVASLAAGQQQQLAAAAAAAAGPLRLVCRAHGELPLALEWLKDGQPVAGFSAPGAEPASGPLNQVELRQQRPASPSQRHQALARWKPGGQLESELYLAEPGHLRRQDAGVYSCAVRNAYGSAERQLRLLLQEAPEPPQVVEVAHIGTRSVTLRWLAPFDGNSPILKYLVEYRHLPEEAQAEQMDLQQLPLGGVSEKSMLLLSVKGQALDLAAGSGAQPKKEEPAQQRAAVGEPNGVQVQHTIHELEPLSRYLMRVVAVNGVARSRPSQALSLRTEEEVPSAVPSLVEAVVLSSNSIRLRWTISYSPGREIIEGFFVGYRSLEAAAGRLAAHSEPATFTYKTVRLASDRPAGAGLESGMQPAALQQQVSGSKQQQQAVGVGAGDAPALIWPVSTAAKGAQPVPQALMFNQHSGARPASQLTLVSVFEFQISGLERNTEYSILIQCFNKKGAGPTSDPLIFKTLLHDPPGKLLLSASEVTESSIKLAWRFLGPLQSRGGGLPVALVSGGQSAGEPQLLDGFVLTYARLARNNGASSASPNSGSGSGSLKQAPAGSYLPLATPLVSPGSLQVAQVQAGGLAAPAEHWQAVQLAGQQRSHQLKNLDCGTAYSLKIWAFNKLGNGEPSDLLTVSTKGKAPVAPDRRSFISVNSSQVRLHLSAWYDGGCDIDKFIVQYRLRGQQEWLLVSNHIIREQMGLTIKDLAPAAAYELLVAAQNQVGLTEARYRFVTLDQQGRPPGASLGLASLLFSSSSSSSAAAASNSNAPDDDEPYEYSAGGDPSAESGRRGDSWRDAGFRSFRYLVESPVVSLVALCLLVASLLAIVFMRSSELLCAGAGAASKRPQPSGGARCQAEQLAGPYAAPAGAALDSDGSPANPGSSLTDSPMTGAGLLPALECPYQSSYCAGQPEYRSLLSAAGHAPRYASPQQQTYASVQKNPSLEPMLLNREQQQQQPTDPAGELASQQTMEQQQQQQKQQQQQCLLQMLMMNQNQPEVGHYASASATLGRCAKARCQSQQVYLATLGREADCRRLQMQPPGAFDEFISSTSSSS